MDGSTGEGRAHRFWLLGVVGLMLVLAACSGGETHGPVVEGNRRTTGTDALITGQVVVENDCIYLQRIEPDTRYPVVWPHGTSWDADQSAIVLSNGDIVHAGDTVLGGGGYYSGDDLPGFATAEGVDLLAACTDNEYGEVAVFNSDETIQVTP